MGVFAMRGKRLNRPPRVRQAGATILLLLLACGVAWGQVPDSEKDPQSPPSDLTKVSIENLMNMEVTSVSKKEQKMSQVAEAIFVITQDDIHHSGATNIPDLLRMAPGMDVTEGAVIVHSVLSPPDNLEVERLAKLSGGNVLTRWNHISSNRSDTTVKFYFDRYERSGPESLEDRKSPGPRVGTRISTQRGSNRRNHRPGFCPGQLVRPFFQLVCAGPNNAETQSSRPVYWDEAGERLFHRARPSAKRALNLDSDSAPHSLGSSIAGHQHSDSARRGLECGAGGAARAGRSCSAGKPGRKHRACYLLRVGYRTQPSARLSFDLAAFFNNYGGLETIEPLPSFTVPNSNPPLLVLPRLIEDKMRGTTEGIEAILNWNVTSRWSVSPGYALLKMHLHTEASSLDTTRPVQEEGSNPAHQAQIRSHA